MKNQNKSSKENFFTRNIAVVVLILLTALAFGVEFLKLNQKLDFKLYDGLLGLSKQVQADENILLVDVGDKSLSEYGEWPWTRDILGDVLLSLRDLGAKTSVFDIEYLSGSSLAADRDINEISSQIFTNGESEIVISFQNYAQMVQDGLIEPADAVEAMNQIVEGTVDPVVYDMFQKMNDGLNTDFDAYFAKAVQFFGNASMTINMKAIDETIDPESVEYAVRRCLFNNVYDPDNLIARDNVVSFKETEDPGEKMGFVPTLHKILSSASGAGFTNVVVDSDGVRRRVELLNSKGDGYYTGQLAFAPLVRDMGVKQFEREGRNLVLKDALMPGKTEREDITIPLDAHGRMLINWMHKSYGDSFKHLEVVNFKYLNDSEEQIKNLLAEIYGMIPDVESPEDFENFEDEENAYIYEDYEKFFAETYGYTVEDANILAEVLPFINLYVQIDEMKSDMLSRCRGFDIDGNAIDGGLGSEDYENYYHLRKMYYDGLGDFTKVLSSMNLPEESDLNELVQMLIDETALYIENYGLLKEYVQNCFCIIGNSATGSTDLGVTPFQKRYANMGTHANVVNTILQKDFIKYVDPWWGIGFSFVIALLVILLTRKVSPAKTVIFGLVYLILPLLLFAGLMIGFKIYIPFASSLELLMVSYLFTIANSFIMTEKDKNTLRRGFDAYVAPEVVSQIVKNPQLLALGGSNKRMTALFSDVRKFSGFTECINREEGEGKGAVRLVEILNGYLGVLSDAIMLERGTIDKYVGDEIVSFFGAPVDNPNNAFDACVAGIRMKQAEDIYNREHLSELPIHPGTKEPFLLKSRVGINTGDMVVGNMGTEKKLNYTIMGNNVNLASRLEGTNKAYDSWIMCSESTWLDADSGANKGKLLAKMLDCVRVVNVEKPVQIYSIQGLRSEMDSKRIEGTELFNAAMAWYLKGRESPNGEKDLQDFVEAKKLFEQAYNCYHETDAQDTSFISTEKKMILRCDEFIANGLPKDSSGIVKPWDGVYTMTSK